MVLLSCERLFDETVTEKEEREVRRGRLELQQVLLSDLYPPLLVNGTKHTSSSATGTQKLVSHFRATNLVWFLCLEI